MPRKTAKKIDSFEEFPEADRLEGFPHPRETQCLYGHDSAKQEFLKSWISGRMHHAWMFSGEPGIGKATLAYDLARIVLRHDTSREATPNVMNVDTNSQVFRQIAALSHPNLLLLRRVWSPKDGRFSAAIPVDEIRRLRNFVGMTGQAGYWRVVIVDKADELNKSSANALLKSLEEPPAQCLYFLITDAEGKLPPTIRSRCRKLNLGPLNLANLSFAVQNTCEHNNIACPNADKLKLLHHISGGRVRQSLELFHGEGLVLYDEVLALLKALPKLDVSRIHSLADKLAPNTVLQDFEMFHMVLQDILRRLIKVGSGFGEAPEQEVRIALKLVTKNTLAQWAELWEILVTSKNETLSLNLDRKNFIVNIFYQMQKLAQLSKTN